MHIDSLLSLLAASWCFLLYYCQSLQAELAINGRDDYGSNIQRKQFATNPMLGEEIDELSRFRRKARNASQLPEFSAPIGNVTAVQGRDVRLVCTIEHLGQYQVAWLKEETKTILSIDTNIITTNYRIFLIPDEEERKWVLHIKDVQSSDRGFYRCQVNTVPMRSTMGYLEVVVPPTIIESQSSQVADVIEHANVSIQCKASGHPRASISWRRDDGLPIRLNGRFNLIESHNSQSATNNTSELDNPDRTSVSQELDDVKSDKLTLYNVDRTMAAIYVCSASNGIPSQVSKRIPLYVKFPPKVSLKDKYISVGLGDQLEVDCIIEAFPKANSYWSKKSSGTTTSLDQRKGVSAANRWYKLMLANGNDNHGALSPSALEADKWKSPNTTSSAIVANDSELSDGDHLVVSIDRNGRKRESYQARAAAQYGHYHNRIQFRQAFEQPKRLRSIADDNDDDHRDDRLGDNSRNSFQSGLGSELNNEPQAAISSQSNKNNRAYMSVKQTAINPFTYKLRLTVAQMQPDDFGQYICVSTNQLGSSEAQVTVTRADKVVGRSRSQLDNPEIRRAEEKDYQHDNLMSDAASQQQTGGLRRSSTGNHVYDENYLQAIKARHNGHLGSSNSQQKLKLRQSLGRNGSNSHKAQSCNLVLIAILLISTIVAAQLPKCDIS